MLKNAYYFPHYCNARHDRKLKRVIKDLGVEGYGLFFMVLETLREQTDFKFPMSDIDLLADEFGTSEAKLKALISSYDLFSVDGSERFFSPKLIFYLQPYFERSERARNAALKRWNKSKKGLPSPEENANADANALPEQSVSYANKTKDKREEKNKRDKKREEQFNECWIMYPKKEGSSKKKSKERFLKLSNKDVNDLKRYLPLYIKKFQIEQNGLKFMKHFENFISAKLWEGGLENNLDLNLIPNSSRPEVFTSNSRL